MKAAALLLLASLAHADAAVSEPWPARCAARLELARREMARRDAALAAFKLDVRGAELRGALDNADVGLSLLVQPCACGEARAWADHPGRAYELGANTRTRLATMAVYLGRRLTVLAGELARTTLRAALEECLRME